MDIKNVVRNLFVTQPDYPDSFAILAGEEFDSGDDLGLAQLLLCYYNPTHFEQNSEGKWKGSTEVFEAEIGTELCDYTIPNSDLKFWRECTSAEIDRAVKVLANKRIAWDNNRLRKMTANETLNFGHRPTVSSTPARNNPYYQGYNRPSEPYKPKKYIKAEVSSTWEQKTPITTMTEEHRLLIIKQCDKLKYSFGTHYGAYESQLPFYENYGCYEDEYCYDY